jgi:CHRD domain
MRFTSMATRGARRRVLAALVAGLVTCSLPVSAGAKYKARLSVTPVNASMLATTAGSGSVTAELQGSSLVITGTFTGLRSPATVARLHQGMKGVRGPAAFDLIVTRDTHGTISGSLKLTAIQVARLEREELYVQVHSEAAPDGNLWGWLLRQE